MAAPFFYDTQFGDVAAYPDLHLSYEHHILPATLAGAAGNRNAVKQNILNLGVRTPVVMMYVDASEVDLIHFVHSPVLFPSRLGHATPFDNKLTALMGNDHSTALMVTFPDESFGRITDARCLRIPHILTQLGAAPSVPYEGPHAGGTAETDLVSTRVVMVAPPSAAADLMRAAPHGSMSRANFLTNHIQTGVAADAPTWEPVAEWFRVVSTIQNAGPPPVIYGQVELVVGTTPAHSFRLNEWMAHHKAALGTRFGVGGPALSNHTFNAGVNTLKDTLDNNAQERLVFERNRRNQTFTDKNGGALAQRMYYLCNVIDDAGLPECHRLLAKSSNKGRDYAILNNLFRQRAQASPVPLTSSNAPLATTTLVDEVFRSFQPGGTGLAFGANLSPFAIVCEGHRESLDALRLIKRAEIAEGSTSLSLADAQTLTTHDVKFPASAHFAGDKLYGWSVVVDVFHGDATPIANSIRNFVLNVVPPLHNLQLQMGDVPKVGLDLICRVLFEAQQEYFEYVNSLAQLGPAGGVPVPSFGAISAKVGTYRASSLSLLPAPWYHMIGAPQHPHSSGVSAPEQGTSSARAQAGAQQVFNSYADTALMERFKKGGYSSINAMLGDHGTDIIPKHSGQAVCLTWVLKGECTNGCRRKAQHVRYGKATHDAIQKMMDTCGVAKP